jgi:VWFA-related protein
MAGPFGRNRAPAGLTESVEQTLGGNGFVDQGFRDQAAMHQIAAATGGSELVDANDLKVALAQALDDRSSYYTIGYVPLNEEFDGKFRKVQVRVDGGNYQLQLHRR